MDDLAQRFIGLGLVPKEDTYQALLLAYSKQVLPLLMLHFSVFVRPFFLCLRVFVDNAGGFEVYC